MVKKRRTAVLFIFLFTASVYLLTISPTINWRDSPEFAHVSYSLGIAHPAGFPAYSLTAKLFTMLPFGSIAFRANFFSLFFAVLSILLIFIISSDILTHLDNGGEERSVILASVISAMMLFVNTISWKNSIIAEVYTFNMFFTLLLICLLIRFAITREDYILFIAAFLYGISSGNHATVAFYLPALLTFYFFEVHEKRAAKLILLCTFFMIGFSVYLYLPLRSLADPAYDWSNPESLSGFLSHITDRKTSYSHFAGFKDLKSILNNLYLYFITLNKNITPLGIILSITGAVFLFKKRKSFFFLLFFILMSNTIFFFDWPGGVQLPSYVCYIIFIAAGLYAVCIRFEKKLLIKDKLNLSKIIVYMMIAVIMALGINNFNRLNRSRIYTADEDFKRSFLKLPENSMVILSYLYFHYRYYQDILGLRKDVTILGYGEVLTPELYTSGTKYAPGDIKGIGYEADLTNTKKINDFIKMNIDSGKRIFTEIITGFKGMHSYVRYYDGFIYEFSKEKLDSIDKGEIIRINEYFNETITKFVKDDNYRNDDEASFIYVEDFISTIDYILKYGYIDSALYMTDTMLKVFGSGLRDDLLENEKNNLRVLAGVTYIKMNELEAAEEIFSDMIRNGENKFEAYNKLGFIYLLKEDKKKAIEFFSAAIEEAPHIMDNYIRLGTVYEELNEDDKAYEVYVSGIKYLYKDERAVLKERMKKLKR